MRRQLGFIALPLMTWAAIAAGAAILVLSGAVILQTSRLADMRDKFNQFKGSVEALGRAAEIATAKANLDNLKRKERTDEQAKLDRARALADARRVRDTIASRGVLPARPDGPDQPAGGPERITFDRAELDRALRDFAAGVAGLVEEGRAATDALNAVKAWAKP